jgi:hypothetical protein
MWFHDQFRMTFKENLESLPVAQGSQLTLLDDAGAEVARIANAPGTAGSFRVYVYLAGKWGSISPDAAEEGLKLFSEHAEDARLNPGKHPNIDRLMDVLSMGRVYSVRIL